MFLEKCPARPKALSPTKGWRRMPTTGTRPLKNNNTPPLCANPVNHPQVCAGMFPSLQTFDLQRKDFKKSRFVGTHGTSERQKETSVCSFCVPENFSLLRARGRRITNGQGGFLHSPRWHVGPLGYGSGRPAGDRWGEMGIMVSHYWGASLLLPTPEEQRGERRPPKPHLGLLAPPTHHCDRLSPKQGAPETLRISMTQSVRCAPFPPGSLPFSQTAFQNTRKPSILYVPEFRIQLAVANPPQDKSLRDKSDTNIKENGGRE